MVTVPILQRVLQFIKSCACSSPASLLVARMSSAHPSLDAAEHEHRDLEQLGGSPASIASPALGERPEFLVVPVDLAARLLPDLLKDCVQVGLGGALQGREGLRRV